MNEDRENLITSSFFDDSLDSNNYKLPLWSKKEELEKVSIETCFLSADKIYSGPLISKRKTREQITQKYYNLYLDRLEAFKVEGNIYSGTG